MTRGGVEGAWVGVPEGTQQGTRINKHQRMSMRARQEVQPDIPLVPVPELVGKAAPGRLWAGSQELPRILSM